MSFETRSQDLVGEWVRGGQMVPVTCQQSLFKFTQKGFISDQICQRFNCAPAVSNPQRFVFEYLLIFVLYVSIFRIREAEKGCYLRVIGET